MATISQMLYPLVYMPRFFLQLCISLLIASPLLAKAPLDERVLNFWFGEGSGQQRWFTTECDPLVRQDFEQALKLADCGRFESLESSAKGRLALILLFDQFSRMIYRGEPRAYGFHQKACELVYQGIEKGHDTELQGVQCAFFLMPLMHSEKLEDQQESLKRYQELAKRSPETHMFLQYAQQHYRVIESFGRFPHRNEVLGRETTPEEQGYLDNLPE